jgi:hypothetical protein
MDTSNLLEISLFEYPSVMHFRVSFSLGVKDEYFSVLVLIKSLYSKTVFNALMEEVI